MTVEPDELHHCDYGDFNGMPVARLQSERSRRVSMPWPGGESYAQVVVRTHLATG